MIIKLEMMVEDGIICMVELQEMLQSSCPFLVLCFNIVDIN